MKQAAFWGQRRIEVREVPIPAPRDDEVLVQVRSCAICGSDKHMYIAEQPPAEARLGGHEYSGEIVALGRGVTRLKVGQRVAMYTGISCGECAFCKRGWWKYCPQTRYHDGMKGFGQYTVIPERAVVPFPQGISYDEGALITDSMGTPGRIVRRIATEPGDMVVVYGLGGIGMNAARFAKLYGATVIGIDLFPMRRMLAVERFGIDHTLDPGDPQLVEAIRALSSDKIGPNKAVEASGSPQGYATLFAAVRPGGRVGLVGVGPAQQIDIWRYIIRRHLELVGSWYCEEEDLVINAGLVTTGRFDPMAIVTHIFPLVRIDEAFRVFVDSPNECLKVIIRPWD